MPTFFNNPNLDTFRGFDQNVIEGNLVAPFQNRYYRVHGSQKFQLLIGHVKEDIQKLQDPAKSQLIANIILSIDERVRQQYPSQVNRLQPQCDKLLEFCTHDGIKNNLARLVSLTCFSEKRQEMAICQAQEELKDFMSSRPPIDKTERIIFMRHSDLGRPSGRQELYLHARKHSNTQVVFKEADLRALLDKLRDKKDLTLVVMADNSADQKAPFLDWTVGEAHQHIAQIILDYPAIGALRAHVCYGARTNPSYFERHKPTDLKKTYGDKLGRALFFFDESDEELPFEESSFAAKIWRGVMAKAPGRAFSISSSPSFVHLDDVQNPSHYVGSEYGCPKPCDAAGHGFFTHREKEYDQLKTITLTTADGIKAKNLKK